MKSLTALLVLASSVFLISVPARRLAGQTDRPAEGHWACTSGNEFPTIYVTPVWDGIATMNDVSSAFAQQLSTKYGYKGRVSCSRANMSGSALAGFQAGNEQQYSQWQKSGKQVVQTGWTYSSARAAPIAPTPP